MRSCNTCSSCAARWTLLRLHVLEGARPGVASCQPRRRLISSRCAAIWKALRRGCKRFRSRATRGKRWSIVRRPTIILEYRVKVVEDKLHDGLLTLNNAIGDVRGLLTKALIVFAALFVVIVLALLIVERWR